MLYLQLVKCGYYRNGKIIVLFGPVVDAVDVYGAGIVYVRSSNIQFGACYSPCLVPSVCFVWFDFVLIFCVRVYVTVSR